MTLYLEKKEEDDTSNKRQMRKRKAPEPPKKAGGKKKKGKKGKAQPVKKCKCKMMCFCTTDILYDTAKLAKNAESLWFFTSSTY